MLTLDAKSIKDYQTCARLYDYRYNDKLYEPINRRDILAQRFDSVLKKVVAFFFYKKQGGSIPSYAALLNRWERLWFPKDTTAYDIATDQYESAYGNLASFSSDAATALMTFHDRFAEDAGEPFLIDDSFTVPLNKDIKLEGLFDLVLRYRSTDSFVAYQWFTGGKRPTSASLTVDFAILKYALEYKLENRQPASVVYGLYDIASTKPSYTQMYTSQEDLDALTYWANEIVKDEIYPSRRGFTAYCKSCPHDEICAKWQGWPTNEVGIDT